MRNRISNNECIGIADMATYAFVNDSGSATHIHNNSSDARTDTGSDKEYTHGILVVRQRGGVAGTDDVEVVHDGTNGLIRARSGAMQVQGAGTNGTLVVSDGVVRPAANNTQDLGGSSQKWKDLYLAGAHIGTFIIRQSGGVAGTDEIQISHDGSNGLMSCKDGVMQVQGAGSSATLVVQSGTVRPGTDAAQDLGSSSQNFKDLYLSGHVVIDVQTITGAGAITLGKRKVNLSNSTGGTFAVTLASATSAVDGEPMTIEMTVGDGTNTVTLATTNIDGSGGSTITFNGTGQSVTLIPRAGDGKHRLIDSDGVTIT